MSHRSNALAAGAVAAALAAGLTVPALAHDTRATHDGSAAAEHADSRAAHQRFAMTFVTLGRRDRPTRVVAAGPIQGRGTMTQRIVKESRHGATLVATLALPDGKVRLQVKDTESTRLDRHTCTARETGTGSWRIVSATGAYRGSGGQGTFVRHAFDVGVFDGHGVCLGESAPPASAAGNVVADGTVSR